MTEQVETRHRICPICEAACGLRITTKGSQILEIRGNDGDVFSDGHTCAKGIALKELHTDPDRLRTPLVRKNGELVPTSWEEAYKIIQTKLSSLIDDHGNDSIATYVGNPTAHNIGLSMGFGVFAGALGSRNLYTAGTVDQIPKQLACELMFGNDMAVPVPDILHCDHFLMIGANPVVSNGSFWVVPKIREKLRAMKQRGGRLIVIDPRRTETARLADTHYFIKPGTDAYLLAGLINSLREIGATISDELATRGATELFAALDEISVAHAGEACGIDESDIRKMATDLSAAENPVVYGRVGTTLQAFGTLTSFLVEVVNLLVGAMDKRGGAMFPEQPFHNPRTPRQGLAHNRFQSRVSGALEVLGQLPVTVLAEEIETEGEGQVRGLICFAGNPVLSNPDSDRLSAALDSLEFMLCVDIYHNETSMKADVVLPGSSAFEDCHYDQFLGSMGYKNAARFSSEIFQPTQPQEWDIGLTLGFLTQHGHVPTPRELREYEDTIIAGHVAAQVADPTSGIHERDVQEIVAGIEPERGVERILDVGIRAGRWGDGFGQRSGLTLGQLMNTPDGVDLGDIRAERLGEVVKHPSGMIDLAPSLIIEEVGRLLESQSGEGLILIGRRSTRTNNTWLRNLTSLSQGSNLCDLFMHPDDARDRGIEDGASLVVTGPGGSISACAKLTEDIAQGVVCLPHGFEDQADGDLKQANLIRGPNYNRIAGVVATDKPSGTAALNGIPVTISIHGF